jgi:hypothetical protein
MAFGSAILGTSFLPSTRVCGRNRAGNRNQSWRVLGAVICQACDKALQKAAVSMIITGSTGQQGIESGYEGLVAKDSASPYLSGRALGWLKVKVPGCREVSADGQAEQTCASSSLVQPPTREAGGHPLRRQARLTQPKRHA